MTVTLQINNDAELRGYIKDMISGQVLSITRDELREMIYDSLMARRADTPRVTVEKIFNDIATREIKAHLKEMGIDKMLRDLVHEVLSEAVGHAIVGRDWSEVIDHLAKEKIKKLL